jgi:pimeloyl-ACP methyl ester carboxylesterase
MHADLKDAKLWYEEKSGAGAAVVFLHAGTGCSSAWRRQLDAFAATGFRAIAYDRRGYGRSEGQQGAAAADDLRALLDLLKIDRAHLVGSAAGAMVAIDFALSFPERTRGLVVANSHVGLQDDDYVQMQRRLRPSPQFEALPPEVRELGPSYRAANPAGTSAWVELERTSRAAGTPTLPKTRNPITSAALEKLAAPALLLGGDADLYMPPSVLRILEKKIRNAKAVVIPECGHSAFWEQPEIFNREVLAFIRQY